MCYKIIRENLDDDAVLWRYMDLSKFLSLLTSESIWLAHSDTFKDKKEGVFHSAIREELDKIYADFYERDENLLDAGIKNASNFQCYLIDNTYISCWHINSEENAVMWELYGQSENSIAIKTTVKKLENSLDLEEVMEVALEVALDKVEYIEHDSAASHKNYRQAFFIKRPHFEFEHEARLYLFARDKKDRGGAPLGYSLNLNINTLIDEVYVHPDSEEWFYSAVQDLVTKYDLNVCVRRGIYGNK